MLPYDGMTRTGSKGVSHCLDLAALGQTPSEARKVLERRGKSKLLCRIGGCCYTAAQTTVETRHIR